MHNILVVEDEMNLGSTLKDYLESKNYRSDHATCAEEAEALFKHQYYSIVLMDIGLPDDDGISLAKRLRNLRKDFVLLFLSAQNDPEIKYQGLEMGAEDYITKPFDLRELGLRLEKALNNHEILTNKSSEISLGNLKIYFNKYLVLDANGNEIHLSQKECAILELLYSHKNTVVSRELIIQKIWGANAFPTNRTVDNYIVKLRKWIETDESKPLMINTVRGIGYQLQLQRD